jgi:beta-fructofuranosidase
VLQLDDRWIWDFWFARHDGRYHVFYLQAPVALEDPDLRHWNATIGHAVSDDLVGWEVLPDALHAGAPGAWDDRAVWTGSVVHHDARWWLFHTGVGEAEDGLVQRIGLAVSDDLVTFERVSDDPILTVDPRWYEELDLEVWVDETCRDPWVFADPDGDGWWMYYTARVREGAADARGVIGAAWSPDLRHWEARPPVTEPGDFGHLEVPQVVEIGGCHYLIFSVYDWAHAETRLQRARPVCGTHYLRGDGPLGPWRSVGDDFLAAELDGPFYAGKLVEAPDGGWVYLAWAQFAADGSFVGALADPVSVAQDPDGHLHLGERPRHPERRGPCASS